ncbi:hypothetical protein FYK55_03530 [Roseiconus nitratireducens]|uniref:FecR protein n=1 Tax=Roseiconus nitratireducens TaxID=2605748 RepID=A0A5M6DEM8_9BACT|nr:LamG-like jellyroll fold domain-containing protein [Roseiconus nitratireducens]KAA5545994.1 hypothetical protein FYK55_03530 [Roseiconus nitratireducens]
MNNETFTRLVSCWLDGSLTETESSELQAELERSADRRDEFVDLCGMDADLRVISDIAIESVSNDDAREESDGYLSRKAPDDPVTGKENLTRVSRGWMGLAAAIAAALLLVVGYGIGRDRSGRLAEETDTAVSLEYVSNEVVETGCAVVSRVVDAKFPDGFSFREGDTLRPGRLRLLSGGLQLDFFSGATMLIEDSGEVDLVSAWEAECLRGKITMHVPPPAIGFRLLAPGLKVIDLGTEFGVKVDSGESSVHVFDGEVEAHLPDSPMRIVRVGESLEAVANQAPVSGRASPDDFPSVQQFEQRREAFYQNQSNQWWASMRSVRTDDRIVGCYLFKHWEDEKWDRLVNNFAIPKQRSRAGSAVGARWVEGRWPTKDALEFKSPGDRVRIDLGDASFDGLTMAAWIRVDGLDRKYNALLLSDGYEDGEPHWQIDQSGRLMFSISYLLEPSAGGPQFKPYRQNQIYRSETVFKAAGRQWHHVAVTYSATTGEAVQYFDGKEVSRSGSEHHRDGRKVTFGRCEIGNWGLPLEGVPFPVRNLNGRVDEFLIFREPLSGQEIEDLYRLGTPD